MANYNLSKGTVGSRSYASPLCEPIDMETQHMICDSDTESVGETEGEW